MINKQSMWFLTLLSLVLVLGVYYVTMPNDLLSSKVEGKEVEEKANVTVTEGDVLIAMRANRDEKVALEIEELQKVLTSETASSEEKNTAFEELKVLNLNIGKEEELEEKIEEDFGIKSYIEINKDNIKVVINSKEHDASLANNIMRSIQSEYKEKMYITVQFE
jgi:stage III sporulation protein AH